MHKTADMSLLDELIEVSKTKLAELAVAGKRIEREMELEQLLLERLHSKRLEHNRKGREKVKPGEKRNNNAPTLTDHIAKLLKENGRAMRGRDIATCLTDRGVTTKSAHGLLPMVLSSLSRRKDRFRKVSRGKYALRQNEKTP